MNMNGAAVIITGASSGIGYATALQFAERGAGVVLAARRVERLEVLATRIRGAGREAIAVRADVALADDVNRMVDATLERFGRIDVLVNNAGFGLIGTIEDTPENVMRELIDVNYMGAFNATRAVLPHMRRQGRGHIVNVASVVGRISFPFHGAYAASKAALIAMTDALRAELAASGVTATIVLPATTRTEFFRSQRVVGNHVSTIVGPQQSPARVAHAIVRSVGMPTPEVNPVPILRVAYGLNAFFPRLRDLAGREFYRRRRGPRPPGQP